MRNGSENLPLGNLVEQRTDKIAGHKDPNIPYIGLEHMAQGSPVLLGTAPASVSVSTNSVFEPDDILFGKLRPNLKKCVQVGFSGYCSTDILVLRTRPGIDPAFAARVLQREAVFDEAVRTAEGTKMPRTSWSKLGQFEVFVPGLAEQRRIAEILDTADEAIQKTEALISKLEQVKAGLTDDLLTRGIDEDGQLRDPVTHPEHFKDSPMGRIPQEWEIRQLGDVLTSIDAGKSPDCPDRPASAGQWGVVKVSSVRPEGFRAGENKVVMGRHHQIPAYEIKDGDLLITRANTYELVGLTCLVKDPPARLMLSDKTLRLNSDKSLTVPDFLAYLMQMPYVRSQIEVNATGSSGSMKNISQSGIKGILVFVPVLEEQHRIVAALDAQDERIRAEEAYRDKLKLLKEGLMGDLLTGRVRVSV